MSGRRMQRPAQSGRGWNFVCASEWYGVRMDLRILPGARKEWFCTDNCLEDSHMTLSVLLTVWISFPWYIETEIKWQYISNKCPVKWNQNSKVTIYVPWEECVWWHISIDTKGVIYKASYMTLQEAHLTALPARQNLQHGFLLPNGNKNTGSFEKVLAQKTLFLSYLCSLFRAPIKKSST